MPIYTIFPWQDGIILIITHFPYNNNMSISHENPSGDIGLILVEWEEVFGLCRPLRKLFLPLFLLPPETSQFKIYFFGLSSFISHWNINTPGKSIIIKPMIPFQTVVWKTLRWEAFEAEDMWGRYARESEEQRSLKEREKVGSNHKTELSHLIV